MTKTDRSLFTEMLEEQRNFMNRVKDERGVDDEEIDNVRAILHETVEYEHGLQWKWWTNEPDVDVKEHYDAIPEGRSDDDALTDAERESYLREEVVDMWHFFLQEVLVRDFHDEDMCARVLERYWSQRGEYQHLMPESERSERQKIVFRIRENLCSYKNNVYIKSVDSGHSGRLYNAFMWLIELTDKHFDSIDDLADEYLEKSEENHKRQDGETERSGYDSDEA